MATTLTLLQMNDSHFPQPLQPAGWLRQTVPGPSGLHQDREPRRAASPGMLRRRQTTRVGAKLPGNLYH